MASKLFVGSLAFSATDDDLAQFFGQFGTVVSAKVITDRETGRSKGFGFVEMSSDAEAQAAIQQGDGKELSGRAINVSEARPREDKPRRDFGGNNRY
ncbi:MAG TPA: RNA-binding protein [Candidatus Saccharimonadales bacterium]|nr:RNA-binding protein [Candidatus Saccharimonadales bacterium]